MTQFCVCSYAIDVMQCVASAVQDKNATKSVQNQLDKVKDACEINGNTVFSQHVCVRKISL